MNNEWKSVFKVLIGQISIIEQNVGLQLLMKFSYKHKGNLLNYY